jgi:hypothetical protein
MNAIGKKSGQRFKGLETLPYLLTIIDGVECSRAKFSKHRGFG